MPVDLQEDARSVKLSWVGQGLTFQVSTDSGRTWEDAENGQITQLKNYGRKLLIRAYLFLDPSTVLDSYSIQINPATFMLFTGKVLEETGLVYFGARWYDPEIGRFISVDPAEDGENWYAYCENDPINYFDSNGEFRSATQATWLLAGPFYFIWDTLKGIAGLVEVLMPYPYLPMPVNSMIVGIRAANAVIKNPKVVLDFAKEIGVGLVGDVIDTIKNFGRVVLGRPTDEEVRKYGKSLTGTALTVIAVLKIAKVCEAAGAAGSGLSMFRRGANLGEFKGLLESMRLNNVRKVAEKAGIGLKGVKVKIIKDPQLIGKGLYGSANGRTISLYPDAFQDAETLVKTLGHERIHIYQFKTFGTPKSSMVGIFEQSAYQSETAWVEYFRNLAKTAKGR